MFQRRFLIGLTCCTWLGISHSSQARETIFNSRLLEIDHPVAVDLRQFNQANTLPAGEYKVDIFINGALFERRQVTFVQDTPQAELHPCFVSVKAVLASFGVKINALKEINKIDESACLDPAPLVAGSKWSLDANKLVLNVTIPQIYLDQAARGYIPPSRWDQGITAAMVNYNFSGTHTLQSDSDEDDYSYLNLQNGFNIGAWRLRNYSTLNSTHGSADYHSVSTWLRRDIASLRSQIMVGDTWTASDVFDSTQIRGARLYTDNDMLPSSLNGFAPVVRGIAKSNATVIIRQNGYVIYQSAVPQGAFEITDLNTANAGGDLDVTIKEEDGSEQHFNQPYASLAILKREGQTDVDMSIGELRNQAHFTPTIIQAQLMRGMPWGMTVYGGMQAANDYVSLALGAGKDLGMAGAISFDVTNARSQFDDEADEIGQSYRFLYSKQFDETNTSFRLVGYRYSTQGFYTLDEWASRHDDSSQFWETGNQRSRIEGTWTQPFSPGFGNLYLTLSQQQYWHTNDKDRLLQIGYSNNWKQVSWNVSWHYSNAVNVSSGDDENNEAEHIFMLSLSVPLSGSLQDTYVNYNYVNNDKGSISHQVGLNGRLLDNNNLAWNLQQSRSESKGDDSGNAGLAYDGTYGSVDASYAWSRDVQRLNYGASGGVLLHSEGITLSQEMGETIALVKAPGAKGLSLENTTGIATDWRGYTVKTQMSPYEENRVAINSDYFSDANVELENSVLTLVPTRGAVVKAAFVTHIGYRILFTVRQTNGKLVPFGAIATATLDSGVVSGIVGENGELYLSGMPPAGEFELNWGNKRCNTTWHLNTQQQAESLIQTDAVCR